MSRKEGMRETVIFDGRTGSVLAITGEVDVEHVEALILDVADGMRVDSVDVSGEEPVPVLSATPASWQAQLEAAIKRGDEKRSEQAEQMRQEMRQEMKAFTVEVLKAVNEAEKGEGEDE